MTATAHKKKDVLTYDLLVSRHIPPKDLTKERDLMRSCWWEYRGTHPAHRTYLFAEIYATTYATFHAKYRDYREAEGKSGLAGGAASDIFKEVEEDPGEILVNQHDPKKLERYQKKVKRKLRALLGLWRARQAADELGISYRIYIASIFEKASMNGWKFLPLPTQLYSDKMKMIALDEQAKEIERYIPDFTNPGLLAGSKAPFKREFDVWLFELGKLRRIHKDLTFKRMAQQGYITDEQAASWTELAESVE